MTSNDTLGQFALDLPHAGPDDTPCEVRSCVRPAEEVLILRGQYRTRCIPHANDLRLQGAQITDLEPGFDRVPGKGPPSPPAPKAVQVSATVPETQPRAVFAAETAVVTPAPTPEIIMSSPPVTLTVLCQWPDCGKLRVKQRFCHTCQGRVQKLLGTAVCRDEDLGSLPVLWKARQAEIEIARRAPRTAVRVDPLALEPVEASTKPHPFGEPTAASDLALMRSQRDEAERLYAESVKGGQELMGQLAAMERQRNDCREQLGVSERHRAAALAEMADIRQHLMVLPTTTHADVIAGILASQRSNLAILNERNDATKALANRDAELYAVDVALHLDGEGVTRHEGDRAETIGQIIDDRDEMRDEGDEITRATGAPVGERVRYVCGLVEQLAAMERERDEARTALDNPSPELEEIGRALRFIEGDRSVGSVTCAAGSHAARIFIIHYACLEAENKLADARKQIEALAFGAGSWHKAYQAGHSDGRDDGEGLTVRDRKVAGKLIEALAGAPGEDVTADALRVLLGIGE